jgi:hypothetical protein
VRTLRVAVAIALAIVIGSSGSAGPEASAADIDRVDARWTTLFSYAAPGYFHLAEAGAETRTVDGRVRVAADSGSSGGADRFEILDSDPGWPIRPHVQKSEARSTTQLTFNKPEVDVGDIRWFATRIYLPYTKREKFEWAHGGSQPYTTLLELHKGSSTGWSAFRLGWEAWQANQGDANKWMNFLVYGGDYPSTRHFERVRLWRLTDRRANRVLANHNRWIDLVWGMRFAPDSTGWLEVWVDGVNVYKRKNRPTMWADDTGQYLKCGLYKRKDASFPESGRSVVYFGRTTIGLTKP